MGLIPFILLISLNTLMLLKLKEMAEERRMSDHSGVSQVTIIPSVPTIETGIMSIFFTFLAFWPSFDNAVKTELKCHSVSRIATVGKDDIKLKFKIEWTFWALEISKISYLNVNFL